MSEVEIYRCIEAARVAHHCHGVELLHACRCAAVLHGLSAPLVQRHVVMAEAGCQRARAWRQEQAGRPGRRGIA